MALLVSIFSIYILIIASTAFHSTDYNPYHQYTFYYETHQYRFNTAPDLTLVPNNTTKNSTSFSSDISSHISIDNISIHILKSASKPYIIQIQPQSSPNKLPFEHTETVSFEYFDDEAFNTIELWHTPDRHRRRLRTCSKRHCKWWSCHTDRDYCPPIAPPNNNPYWIPRYSHKHRFIGYYPGKDRLRRYFHWTGCAHHCIHWFGGLASINNAWENSMAHQACHDILLNPRPEPYSEYGRAQGWRGHSCYIGLRRPFKEWSDRRPVRYTKWHPGEPNNWGHKWGRGEDCTELYVAHGTWNDLPCNHKRACVCQKPRGIVHGNYVGVQSIWPYHHASEYCAQHYGTELATITSDADQKIAYEVCLKICAHYPHWCNCWIGLQRPHHEWDDGTNAEEKYTNWNPGQPDNWRKSEGCSELVAKGWRGKWNDVSCGAYRYFICNLRTSIQRMDFNDREEMISKRLSRHKIRWQQYQQEAHRKKIRKAFFDRMKQQRNMMRKQRREQAQRMREYYRQMAFKNAMGNVGSFGGKSVFYGDVQEKKRRLREFIEGQSEGMKRVKELELEKKKKKAKHKEERRLDKKRDRDTDTDALFYEEYYADNGDMESMDDERALRQAQDTEDTNPSARRCVFVSSDRNLYEVCLNDEYVEVSKYMHKVLKSEWVQFIYDADKNLPQMISFNVSKYDTMEFDELQRFRYQIAMQHDNKTGNNASESIAVHKVEYVQFLKVIELIYDHEKTHKKQCYSDEGRYETCLEFNEVENEMQTYVQRVKGYLRNEGRWISFENDEDWNEINHIYNDDNEDGVNVDKIKKCATDFDYKVCVIQITKKKENEDTLYDEYRMTLMKMNKRDVDQDAYTPYEDFAY